MCLSRRYSMYSFGLVGYRMYWKAKRHFKKHMTGCPLDFGFLSETGDPHDNIIVDYTLSDRMYDFYCNAEGKDIYSDTNRMFYCYEKAHHGLLILFVQKDEDPSRFSIYLQVAHDDDDPTEAQYLEAASIINNLERAGFIKRLASNHGISPFDEFPEVGDAAN